MNSEESKLFEEFKVVIDSVEAHTYDKYIKPQLEIFNQELKETRKEMKLFLIITTLEFFILLLLLTHKDLIHFFKNMLR